MWNSLKWLLTIILVGSHFFLTGKLDAYLYDFWPNERLEYNLAMSLYLASAFSATVIGLVVYMLWTIKVKVPSFSKEKQEEEEEGIQLPEGPLYNEKAVKQFALYCVKTSLANYGNVKKELDNAVDSNKQYDIILERYWGERTPKPEWS
jgi:hypothetical protein